MPDVVIVGGGIIGAACAYELAGRGVSVTLVERDHLAAHASGRNQGLWVIPDDPANLSMAQASLSTYLDLAPTAAIDIGIDAERVGLVAVAATEEELPLVRANVDAATANGVRVQALDTAEDIEEVEPALARTIAGAWLIDQGHRLDPGALTVALALAAAERGAEIRHHLHARALARKGDTVVGVATDDGVIGADATVVAAGPWSDRLLEPIGLSLPIIGARGWLVRLGVRPGLLRHLVELPGPHGALRSNGTGAYPTAVGVATDGPPGSSVGTILHPARDGTLLVGSSRQTWLTPEPPDAEAVSQLLTAAIALVPELADAPVRSSWWGIRPISPDDRPFVGRVGPGLFVATGHGSEGVILGAGTAELLAAQYAGEEPPFDAAPFDPLRFAP